MGGGRSDEARWLEGGAEREHLEGVGSSDRVNIWDDGQCEIAGHVWVSAGGDLAICMVCEAECWADDDTTLLEDAAVPSSTPSRGLSGV